MKTYYVYVSGIDGQSAHIEADSASDAAEEYAERYRQLDEDWSGHKVMARSDDMSETAEATI